MKRLLRIGSILVMAVCMLSGCRKKTGETPSYINEHFKDTFDYKVGTYWIFYDSLSGAMDTFTIIANTHHEPVYNPNYLSDNVEWIVKLISDTGDGPQLLWGFDVGAPFGLSITSTKGGFSYGLMYGWPFQQTYATLLTSYSDAGNVYQNIYYRKSTHYASYSYEFESWFSPEVGFVTIKYTSSIIGNKSLHLVAHNIIRH